MGRQFNDCAKAIIDSLDLPLTIEEYCILVHEEHKKLFPTTNLLAGMISEVYRS